MADNSIITKVTGTDTSSNRIASTFYGTCSTAQGTAQKDVTLADSCVFNDNCLVTGATIHVKFTNSNTHATPTLKVGTATAKDIKAYGTTKPGKSATTSWYAGSVVSFTYDGTYWQMNDYKQDTNTNNAVTQTATTTNSTYEVLFSETADNTTRTEGARKTDTFKYNPSTDTLTAGNINISGNISTVSDSGLLIVGKETDSLVMAKMVKGIQVAFSNLTSVWDDGQGTVTTGVVTSTDTDGTFVFYDGLKKGLVDLIYPVGSYFHSSVHTNPGDLFGGTWEEVTNTLVAKPDFSNVIKSSTTYTNGATYTATQDCFVWYVSNPSGSAVGGMSTHQSGMTSGSYVFEDYMYAVNVTSQIQHCSFVKKGETVKLSSPYQNQTYTVYGVDNKINGINTYLYHRTA